MSLAFKVQFIGLLRSLMTVGFNSYSTSTFGFIGLLRTPNSFIERVGNAANQSSLLCTALFSAKLALVLQKSSRWECQHGLCILEDLSFVFPLLPSASDHFDRR